MRVIDIWYGDDVADRIGHAPGAWDCPCGPWVKTDMDKGENGERTVRHVRLCATCMLPAPCPTMEALNEALDRLP